MKEAQLIFAHQFLRQVGTHSAMALRPIFDEHETFASPKSGHPIAPSSHAFQFAGVRDDQRLNFLRQSRFASSLEVWASDEGRRQVVHSGILVVAQMMTFLVAP